MIAVNYFRTILRILYRNRTYSIINILGLSLGISLCLSIFLIIRNELAYDSFHSNRDEIFRIVSVEDLPTETIYDPGCYYPTGKALRSDFPELQNVVMVKQIEEIQVAVLGSDGERKFIEERTLGFTQSPFFQMFDFKLERGDPENILDRPNVVVLGESLADKYFSDQDPVGKTIRLDNQLDLEVVGIMRDLPQNTVFPFQMVGSFQSLGPIDPMYSEDGWHARLTDVQAFVQLPSQMDPIDFDRQLEVFIQKYLVDAKHGELRYQTQPLADIHFDTRFGDFEGRAVSKESLAALGIIGLLILMAACINFINLATAQAVKRSKEVGIRKVLGSTRNSLVAQFLLEATIITTISMVIALGLTEFVLRYLVDLTNFGSQPELLFDWIELSFMMAILLFTTLLSGFYPAIVLSGFLPVQALKGKIPNQKLAGHLLRRGLVTAQFSITQILIFGTLVVMSQLEYFTSQELGFRKEGVVITPIADSVDLKLFRTRLMEHPGITNVSFALGAPTSTNDLGTRITYREKGEEPIPVNVKFADLNYLDTYQIPLLAGRNLRTSDSLNHVIINRALVKTLGLSNSQDALGIPIDFMGKDRTVIGVVEDFHMVSFAQEINPMVLANYPDWFYQAGIRIDAREISSSIAHIESVWSEVFPEHLFDYQLLDQEINELYRNEIRIAHIFQFFSITAILIGCLGLFGLISFVANSKTKEIGIRKALGASVIDILAMFSSEFSRLILIGFAIGTPIAYYLFNRWLEDFSYHVTVSPWIFFTTFGLTLAVATLTVSYQSLQSTLANPVDSLQYE